MTTTDTLEMLERAYQTLQGQGLTTSKAAFSEKWLGRAPSYLTSMRARNRQVSPEVLDFFYQQLERYVGRFAKLIYSPYATNLQNKVAIVMDVLDEVGARNAWPTLGASLLEQLTGPNGHSWR